MMDELSVGFEQLKISALNKLKYVKNDVCEVTIGPNCSRNQINKPRISQISTKKNKLSVKDDTEKEKVEYKYSNNVNETLRKLEIQRSEEVKRNIQKRENLIADFSKKQEDHRKKEWLRIQQTFIDDIQKKENNMLEVIDRFKRTSCDEHAKLVQHYKGLAEQKMQKELELKEKENYRKMMQINFERVKKNQQIFREEYQQIIPIFKKCVDNQELKNILGEEFKLLKTLPEKLEEITTKCKTGKVTENEVQESCNLVSEISELKDKVEKTVNEINNSKMLASQKQKVTEPIANVMIIPEKNKIENPDIAKTPETSLITHLNMNQYVSSNNLQLYIELMNFLENHNETFKELQNDLQQKQFIFDCKKAINIPVNSLSGINAEHLLDKYTRLHNLLKGQDVIVSDKRVNASKHPQGIAFCKDLLAKKFVLQGDLMVSSNPESALSYATVIISLWNDFPDFGQLILAYFYKSCPYLVPFYIPKQKDESDEDYYKKRGYQYTDGLIEKQDKFLKRMTGIIRLYTAILIMKPKRGQQKHPHNIQNGWRLLASVLKLEPEVDITATVLHTVLETAGFYMEMKYGRIFQNLVHSIAQYYLPKCKEKCTGGATTRLELLFTEYFKNRRFVQPSGYKGHCYW